MLFLYSVVVGMEKRKREREKNQKRKKNKKYSNLRLLVNHHSPVVLLHAVQLAVLNQDAGSHDALVAAAAAKTGPR